MSSWIPARLSVKYIAALIVLIAAVGFTGSALISLSYEKAVVRYLKTYLEEHLMTRLSMDENIRFRFLKGFPNTTVEVKNILLLSGADFSRKDFRSSYSDTLLYAQSAYLRFNPFKMLRKKYELKKIEISHGIINILIDTHNKHNLKIWKSDHKGSADYSVTLKNIVISDTRVRIQSLKNHLTFEGRSVRSNFKGSLSSNVLSGVSKGHFRIKKFSVEERNIALNSNLQVDINLIYSGERFRVSKGTVQLNKAIANISGEYIAGKNSAVDLLVEIPHFGLNELMSVIPAINLHSDIYEFDGNGIMTLMVKGPLGNKDQLTVSSLFTLNDCTARNKSSRTSISDINLKGQVSGTNASNFVLRVDTFRAKMGKGNLNGKLSVSNLKKLSLSSDVSADLDLKELSRFIGMDSVDISGRVRSRFRTRGNLKGLSDDSLKTIVSTLHDGVFDFENVDIKFSNTPLSLENGTGRAIFGETIRLENVSLRFNETDILIAGEILDLNSYLAGKSSLKPELAISCDILDITKYLKRDNVAESKTGYSNSLSLFPDNIYARVMLNSKKLIAGKFEAEDVSVKLSAVHDSMLLDHFVFKFPDGSINGTAVIKAEKGNQYSVTCRAEPEKINIRQLFYVFNNFTQQFILDKNLKGLVGGTINFYARWDSAFRIMPASVRAAGEIEISNGELVQFEPMLKLSKYIDVEELRHIRFKTLKNSIYISDRMVSIPEMNINSSAFNINVSGEHSFDNVFDYRLRVLLSEVLFNKARKKKSEINEFFVEETSDDRTTIPLIIAGTPKDFDVKFDRRKAFGLSRNRNNVNQIKPASDNFQVEWEEPPAVPVEKPEVESEPSGVVIEWEE